MVLPPLARTAAKLRARLQAEGARVRVLVPLATESLRAPLEEALAAEELGDALLVEPGACSRRSATRANELKRRVCRARADPGFPSDTGAARRDVLAAADLALCKTGSVNVELALLGVPQVACYKVGAISAAIARRLLKFDPDSTHISLVNLVLDERVHPEFVQEACDVSNVDSIGAFAACGRARRMSACHEARARRARARACTPALTFPRHPRCGACLRFTAQSTQHGRFSKTRAARGGAPPRPTRAFARRSAAAGRRTAPLPRCSRRRSRPTGSACPPTGSTRAAGATRAGSGQEGVGGLPLTVVYSFLYNFAGSFARDAIHVGGLGRLPTCGGRVIVGREGERPALLLGLSRLTGTRAP